MGIITLLEMAAINTAIHANNLLADQGVLLANAQDGTLCIMHDESINDANAATLANTVVDALFK